MSHLDTAAISDRRDDARGIATHLVGSLARGLTVIDTSLGMAAADHLDGPAQAVLMAVATCETPPQLGQTHTSLLLETLLRELLRHDEWLEALRRRDNSRLASQLTAAAETAVGTAVGALQSSELTQERLGLGAALVVWPLVAVTTIGETVMAGMSAGASLREVGGRVRRPDSWCGEVADATTICLGANLAEQVVANIPSLFGGAANARPSSAESARRLVTDSIRSGSGHAAAAVARLAAGVSPPLESVAEEASPADARSDDDDQPEGETESIAVPN